MAYTSFYREALALLDKEKKRVKELRKRGGFGVDMLCDVYEDNLAELEDGLTAAGCGVRVRVDVVKSST